MELLQIETYNDGQNTIILNLRDINIKSPKTGNGQPFIQIICEEVQNGPMTLNKPKITPFTIFAVNAVRVPIYKMVNGAPAPVWEIEPAGVLGEPGYVPGTQATIGEFDMWKVLVFQNHLISLNDAITQGIKRQKGLINSPLAFIMPG